VTRRTEVRIPPRPKAEWDDEVRTALESSFGAHVATQFASDAPDAPHVPNVVSTLMHHPGLARRWLAFNNVLLRTSALDDRQRELMVLRVAWRTRSAYEWMQHVRMAAKCGISGDEIAAISRDDERDPSRWSPLEGALLAATDELLDDYVIGDATWARLAEHLDERQLTEVCFVVGAYTCLAMLFNSVGLELDPDLLDIPAPNFPDA
jgi:alkylhydroperoxidase family enzyme